MGKGVGVGVGGGFFFWLSFSLRIAMAFKRQDVRDFLGFQRKSLLFLKAECEMRGTSRWETLAKCLEFV